MAQRMRSFSLYSRIPATVNLFAKSLNVPLKDPCVAEVLILPMFVGNQLYLLEC